MTTIHILLSFLAFGAVFAQFEQCYDLVGGLNPETNEFSDPRFVNGQAYGNFSYNFTDINGELYAQSFNIEGFNWQWRSRGYGSGNGGNTPTLMQDSEYGLFWNFPAPGFNGWQWNNNFNSANENREVRTCGSDNETLTDGPGTMSIKNSWWGTLMPPTYNLTFWQKLYVPSSPTANWARVIHYINNPGAETIHMNYMASSYPNTILYTNPGSTERFSIFSDVDQGKVFRYMPTSYNWMGKNARLQVSGSYALDNSIHGLNSNFNLAPGATVGIMIIYSLGMNINQVSETAKWADTNPAELYAKLTEEDISMIMNWDACASAFDNKVSVQITQTDKCATSAKMDISTTGTTLNGAITHRVLNATGDVVASDLSTSVTLTESGDYLLESWALGCVVKRTPFTAVINDAQWNSNTGEFNGSNGPFKFVAGNSDSITITDKNGCTITGSFAEAGTKTSGSATLVFSAALVMAAVFILL